MSNIYQSSPYDYRHENIYRSEEIIEVCHGLTAVPSIKVGASFNDLPLKENPMHHTKIDINDSCTISAALDEYPRSEKLLLLNMANANTIGGGWLTGAEAQEEYLFRRTDLHLTLVDRLYPMKSHEVIYSPVVRMLYDAEYNPIEPEHYVSVVSVAAACRPYLVNGHLHNYVMEQTRTKVRLIFHLAAMNRHDCLILGALGCGAFCNPPDDMANIFADMCAEYAGYFKKIVFAIKCVKDDTNLATFQQVFLSRWGVKDPP